MWWFQHSDSNTFLTSQLPKTVRSWCALFILASKCALHHRAIHVFDITTSNAVHSWCALYILTLLTSRDMLFHHEKLNLLNVLRATALCTFRHLIFQKRSGCDNFQRFLPLFTSKCASHHNRVQVFISPPVSSAQMAPHPPLLWAYFSTLRSQIIGTIFLAVLFHLSRLSEVPLLKFFSVNPNLSNNSFSSDKVEAGTKA